MNNFFKAAVLSLATLATAAAPMSQALAHGPFGPGPGPYYGGGGYYAPPPPPPYRHHSHRRDHSDAIAAGVIGLAAGAIIGGALSQPAQPNVIYQAPPPPAYYPPQPQPVYQQPRPIYQPQPVYRGLDPWTPGWYDYCSRKYRSFNSQTGTFRGNDGRDHFCNIP